MLFTGDIEKIAEERLLHMYKKEQLNADILKIAHHGSKSSSTENFIEAVNPKIVLIGVWDNNKFGHPNSEVIKRLKKRDIKVYRTDINGEINIEIKENKIKIPKVQEES